MPGGQVGSELGRGRHRIGDDLRQDRARLLGGERQAPGERAIQDHAQGPDVAAPVDVLLAAHLLRAHVLGRAEKLPGFGAVADARRGVLRDAEVEHLDDLVVVGAREEQVVGLQIAMNDARLVGLAQGLRGLGEDARGLGHGDATLTTEALGEVFPVQELHHQVGRAFVHAVVDHVHDVGALQRRRGLRFALETGPSARGLGDREAHELHRDLRAQPHVPRDPDRAHAPLGEGAQQLVAACDDGAGVGKHRVGRGAGLLHPGISREAPTGQGERATAQTEPRGTLSCRRSRCTCRSRTRSPRRTRPPPGSCTPWRPRRRPRP
jgi:hypothetical protein